MSWTKCELNGLNVLFVRLCVLSVCRNEATTNVCPLFIKYLLLYINYLPESGHN